MIHKITNGEIIKWLKYLQSQRLTLKQITEQYFIKELETDVNNAIYRHTVSERLLSFINRKYSELTYDKDIDIDKKQAIRTKKLTKTQIYRLALYLFIHHIKMSERNVNDLLSSIEGLTDYDLTKMEYKLKRYILKKSENKYLYNNKMSGIEMMLRYYKKLKKKKVALV